MWNIWTFYVMSTYGYFEIYFRIIVRTRLRWRDPDKGKAEQQMLSLFKKKGGGSHKLSLHKWKKLTLMTFFFFGDYGERGIK